MRLHSVRANIQEMGITSRKRSDHYGHSKLIVIFIVWNSAMKRNVERCPIIKS